MRKWLWVIISCFIFFICLAVVIHSPSRSSILTEVTRDIPSSVEIDYVGDLTIALSLPETGNTEIDIAVQTDVYARITSFLNANEENSGEINVINQSFYMGDYMNINLLLYFTYADGTGYTTVIAGVYDSDTGDKLTLVDVFGTIGLETLNTQLCSSGSYEVQKDYSCFNIGTDGVTIYYEGQYDVSLGVVNYSSLGDSVNVIYIEKNYPLFSSEKIVAQSVVVDVDTPVVALTFDDGPSEHTQLILDALEEVGGRATFFVLGENVKNYPEVLVAAAKLGNEIGNHTYSHKSLAGTTETTIAKQIGDTASIIYDTIGIIPTLLRPPYGAIDEVLQGFVDYPLILWSIDTEDWKYHDSERLVEYTLSKVEDGSIVLMHDSLETTAEGAVELIKELSAMGYQLVTVSELMKSRGIEMVAGEIYSNGRI